MFHAVEKSIWGCSQIDEIEICRFCDIVPSSSDHTPFPIVISMQGAFQKLGMDSCFHTNQKTLHEKRHTRAGRVPADAGIQCANERDK